jgi:predicted metalloprotease with PDZ domain
MVYGLHFLFSLGTLARHDRASIWARGAFFSFPEYLRIMKLSLSRSRFAFSGLLTTLFFLWLSAAASAAPNVAYKVTLAEAGDDSLQIEMKVKDVAGRPALDVAMPAWTPGSYEILNHARQVSEVEALGEDGKPLAVRRIDKQTWRVASAGQASVTVRYYVSCDRLSVDSSWLGEEVGQIDGSSVFLYLPDARSAASSVEFALPKEWKVAIPLAERAPMTFDAPSYDALIDAPAVVGKFVRTDFQVLGKPFSVVTVRQPKNPVGIRTAITKIAEVYAEAMGGLPFDRYVFFYVPYEEEEEEVRIEGLEHRNSTLINYWPETVIDEPEKLEFLTVTAHEFFHAWNVKRLKPKEFTPYALDRELYTPQLWFAEGVTEYYAWLGLVRAKLITPEVFADNLQLLLGILQNNENRKGISLEEASVTTWLTGTSNYDEIPLDYYGKGMLVGLLLDIEIRSKTDGARGLDDVMRELFKRFPEGGPGYGQEDLITVAGQVAGTDLSGFFKRYVTGTDELPYAEYLEKAGFSSLAEPVPTLEIGFDVELVEGSGLEVTQVDEDSPAEDAGIEEGDLLKSFNGKPVTSLTTFETASDNLKEGVPVKVVVEHSDGKTETLTLTPTTLTTLDIAVGLTPNPTAAQLKIRNGLFRTGMARAAGQ